MNKNVMVVDDKPHILIALRELFEYEGFAVVTADSGRECLENLKQGFKGVILMDIMMPDMDGWDTIREMIKGGFVEGNLISMLTAKAGPDPKMDGLQEYVMDYITKPFDIEEIVSTVKGYLAHLE